jgi:hypothetical protein
MWGTVVTALVGALGLAGVIYTQHQAGVREDKRWQREHAAERERQTREDALLFYDHRRQAYVDFMREILRLEDFLVERMDRDPRPYEEPPENWLDELHNLSVSVQIFGTRAAWIAANDAIEALDNVNTSESWRIFRERFDTYVEQIRQDLGVRDT